MFSLPFSVGIGSVPPELQLEFIDLQCDSAVKCKSLENSILIEFYSKYMTKDMYLGICKHELFMFPIFGCTYTCEQFFSKMKNIKSKTRT